MAIDGNPQVRVMFIISQNKPDSAIKADVMSRSLQGAYPTAQDRNLFELSQQREGGMKVCMREAQGTK